MTPPTPSRSSPTSTPTSPRCKPRSRASTNSASSEIYCGGDLVGYGPHPNEVCALIAEREIPTIYGNYDYAIARDLDDCGCAYITPQTASSASARWSGRWRTPTRPSKDFMRELPFDLRFAVGETDVHLVHGSPRKVNEYLFEDKPARLYERLAAAESDQVLVFGHTHKPWVHEYGGVLFVNCGSVGKPKDGDPRAAFAILRSGEDGDRGHDRARRLRRRGRRPRGRRRRPAHASTADKLLIAA